MRSVTLPLALFGISLALVSPFSAGAQQPHLEFSGRPLLVNCQPVSSRPCFETTINFVDGKGRPVPTALSDKNIVLSSLLFNVDGEDIRPFYAMGAGNVTELLQSRVAVLLVDVSGSMNRKLLSGETRFAAAKSALTSFVDTFRDGGDYVAIIPFESHGVESTIRSAVFATTKQGALDQIASIPLPQANANTGLYSAVSAALRMLTEKQAQLAQESGQKRLESMLLVMTDGSNEVLRGDDPNLLAGPAGLSQAEVLVKAANLPVIGIGFGDAGDIDINAMHRLTTSFYMAADVESLKKAFKYARALLEDRLVAAFPSPWPDLASMAGRTVEIRATFKVANGDQLLSGSSFYQAPQIGPPVFERRATSAELTALLALKPENSYDLRVIRPVLVLLGLSLFLFLLWFWVPRLVWPNQYVGSMPRPVRPRWAASGKTLFSRSGSKFAPPDGFSGGNRGPGVRNATDPTFVQSRLSPRN